MFYGSLSQTDGRKWKLTNEYTTCDNRDTHTHTYTECDTQGSP